VPQVEILANEDGYVGTISVKSGQRVQAGELLCKLEQPELKKKESLIKSELDYLHNNPYKKGMKTEATAKRSRFDFAVSQKNHMKTRLDEVTQMFNRGAATDAEVKFARFQYEEALMHLTDLEASVLRAKDTTRMMQSAVEGQDELRIKELVLERKQLELQVKALSIYAPIPGSISEIRVVEGSYVSRGDIVFTLTKNEKVHINAYLTPEHVDYTVAGKTAEIVFADGERVSAKVLDSAAVAKSMSPKKAALPGFGSYEVMVQLEFVHPVKQKLRNGLPVEVFF
jgi:multidrug resistance efflux pump